MDVPFYEDEIMPIDSSSENTMYDKTAMKLDLNSTLRQSSFDNSILTSPDLNLLKLASPELEKLILNCGSLVTPTPQGMKNSNTNLTVTEQQELYARGFLEALQKLHQEQGAPGVPGVTNTNPFTQNQTTSSIGVPTRPVFTQAPVTLVPSTVPIGVPMLVSSAESLNTAQNFPSNTLSTISTGELPLESVRSRSVTSQIFPQFQNTGTAVNAQTLFQNAATNYSYNNQGQLNKVKIEESLQVVPGTPPLPPIDLDLQEAVKSERKKLRNRLAASKCRRRKLEKEADLEKKVSELKDKNSGLQTEAMELRKQICQLKEQVMTHINGGCKVYLSQTA